MHIDTMRWIDRTLGKPACWFLSLEYRFMRMLGLKKPNTREERKNFLFIELAEMGSSVLSYSAMAKVKELYPKANLYFLTFERNRNAADLFDIIPKQNILTVRDTGMIALSWDLLKFMFKSRNIPIDVVFDLELFSRVGAVVSYLSGARDMVGFHRYHNEGLYKGTFQTHKVWYNAHQHMSKNFLSLVYALEAPEGEVPLPKKVIPDSDIIYYKLPQDKALQQRVFGKLQKKNPSIKHDSKIVLLTPDASALLPLRKWPWLHYVALTKMILKHPGVFVVITGVGSDKETAQAIARAAKNERVIDFTGETSLIELIALYQISAALVANDSGGPHFASLTEIPILVFFGPETPELYKPLSKKLTVFYSGMACSPCVSAANHRKSPCKDNLCLQVITAKSVYEEVKKVL